MTWVVVLGVAAFIFLLLVLYWIWNRGRYGKIVVAASLVFSGCAFYLSIYPSDAYYRAEFERVARLPFPSSGKILFSNSSTSVYSTYRSCAVFTVSKEEFHTLRQAIAEKSNSGMLGPTSDCLAHSERLQKKSMTIMAGSEFTEPGGTYWQWGVLVDGRSVVYSTMRWKNLNPV